MNTPACDVLGVSLVLLWSQSKAEIVTEPSRGFLWCLSIFYQSFYCQEETEWSDVEGQASVAMLSSLEGDFYANMI